MPEALFRLVGENDDVDVLSIEGGKDDASSLGETNGKQQQQYQQHFRRLRSRKKTTKTDARKSYLLVLFIVLTYHTFKYAGEALAGNARSLVANEAEANLKDLNSTGLPRFRSNKTV